MDCILSLIDFGDSDHRAVISFIFKKSGQHRFMKKRKKRKKRKRAQGTRTKARDFGKVQPKKWLHKIPDLKIGRPKAEESQRRSASDGKKREYSSI